MRFGKLEKQKKAKIQVRLAKLAVPREWFAWRPIKVHRGAWVWLEIVRVEYNVQKTGSNYHIDKAGLKVTYYMIDKR